jgi:hypothetical protein
MSASAIMSNCCANENRSHVKKEARKTKVLLSKIRANKKVKQEACQQSTPHAPRFGSHETVVGWYLPTKQLLPFPGNLSVNFMGVNFL